MNGRTPWLVVGLVVVVTLVLPYLYRKIRTALFERQGFVPLADLLKRRDATPKEFWNQVETRGTKVRMKSRGENAFVNVEDAAAVIDSIPRQTSQSDRFAERLQVIGLSAIAGAAASRLVVEDSVSATPAPIEVRREIIIARNPNWTVSKTGEDVFQEDGNEQREDMCRIDVDPRGFESPVEFYSALLNVPQFLDPHTSTTVAGFLEWVLQANGLSPEVTDWVSTHRALVTNIGAVWPSNAGEGRNRPASISDSLQGPLQKSMPFRTHTACCWGVAMEICGGHRLHHARLARVLRILSNDRANHVWHGVPLLTCDFSVIAGGVFSPVR